MDDPEKKEEAMIRIGVCGPLKMAESIHKAGFDYFEGSVTEILCPLEEEAVFETRLSELQRQPIASEALNCMLPGSIKVVGPEVDNAVLDRYVSVLTRRAARAGVKVVVFGSGGSRRIPDDFELQRAEDQLLTFGQLLGDRAADAGVVIALEPLNRSETNIFNTAAEGADWVRRADRPALRLLIDAYHLMRENEPAAVIIREAPLLAHMHVATCANRLAPGLEPCNEIDDFFAAVKASGYSGRMSVEGGFGEDPQASLPQVCAFLRNALR